MESGIRRYCRQLRLWTAAALLAATATAVPAQTVIDASRIGSVPIQKQVRTFRDLRYRNMAQQRYDFSCGTAALATLLRYGYGYADVSETELIKRMMVGADPQQVVKNGFSMLDMKRYVESIGLRAHGFRIDAEALYRLQMPVITLVEIRGYRHFVLVKGAQAGRVFIADPALGHRVVYENDFVKDWNGIVLAVLDDQPMASDSPLLNDRTSLALRQRMGALDSATSPAPVVEFGLVRMDLF
ncbi:C39 family peptidase [Lysobacter cavernae]|uniref:C39 family peptidase n=1 Tax=Lysobacter cavernae TaxID=1685901 RepID=A0ABV7RUD7_9GAMM